MKAPIVLAVLLAALPALAQDPGARPAVGPPPIHPSDLSRSNSEQRIDDIRRSGAPADYGQMNSLESLRQQSDGMGGSTRAPIPPERRDVAPRAVPSSPQSWPGYQPGYLPRQ